MSLTLLSLKVFLAVAKDLSFTRAAEEMFISQPAVSLHIQKLEQLFQAQLFIRPASGRIQLTAAGTALVEYAERMVRLESDIFTGMAGHSAAMQREIRIGTCSISGEYLVSLGMDAFRQAHPEAVLSFSITRCENVFEGLLKGEYDIGVAGMAPRSRVLDTTLLAKTRMLFFEARTGRRESRRLSVGQLRNERLILREKGAGSRIEFQDFLACNGVSPGDLKVVSESESNEAIITLVKEGYGISVLPEFMVRQEIERGALSTIALREGQPTQSFFMVKSKQVQPSPLARALMSMMQEYASVATESACAG